MASESQPDVISIDNRH